MSIDKNSNFTVGLQKSTPAPTSLARRAGLNSNINKKYLLMGKIGVNSITTRFKPKSCGAGLSCWSLQGLWPLIDWVYGIIKYLGPSLYSIVSMIVQGNVVSAPRPMRAVIKEALVKVGPMPRLPSGVSNEMIFAAIKEGVKVKMAEMMDASLIEKKGTRLLQELFFKALESQIKDKFF